MGCCVDIGACACVCGVSTKNTAHEFMCGCTVLDSHIFGSVRVVTRCKRACVVPRFKCAFVVTRCKCACVVPRCKCACVVPRCVIVRVWSLGVRVRVWSRWLV